MTDDADDPIDIDAAAAAGLLYWSGIEWSAATERQRDQWRGAVCAILDVVFEVKSGDGEQDRETMQ